jgi:hypothetical protein
MTEFSGLLSSTVGGTVNSLGRNLFGNGADISGGNRSYLRGMPLMLRTSRYATIHNKANRAILAMPRLSFMYYASFIPGRASSIRDFSSWQNGFSFQIQKIDRPQTSPTIKSVNQYNRRRLVHTGLEHQDITIVLHDTVDDRVLRVWRDYYEWYFGDGRRTPNASARWTTPVNEPRTQFIDRSNWGFAPKGDGNIFDRLEIYMFYGKKYTQLTIYNPKISRMEWDSLSQDNGTLLTATMTIQHEGYSYTAVAQPLTNSLINQFNLNSGDYFEPEDLFGGVNTFLMDLNDSFQDAVDSILGNTRNIPFVGQVLSGLGSDAIRASGVGGIIPRVASGLASTSLNRWGNFK